jgi:hypothetical protein
MPESKQLTEANERDGVRRDNPVCTVLRLQYGTVLRIVLVNFPYGMAYWILFSWLPSIGEPEPRTEHSHSHRQSTQPQAEHTATQHTATHTHTLRLLLTCKVVLNKQRMRVRVCVCDIAASNYRYLCEQSVTAADPTQHCIYIPPHAATAAEAAAAAVGAFGEGNAHLQLGQEVVAASCVEPLPRVSRLNFAAIGGWGGDEAEASSGVAGEGVGGGGACTWTAGTAIEGSTAYLINTISMLSVSRYLSVYPALDHLSFCLSRASQYLRGRRRTEQTLTVLHVSRACTS